MIGKRELSNVKREIRGDVWVNSKWINDVYRYERVRNSKWINDVYRYERVR